MKVNRLTLFTGFAGAALLLLGGVLEYRKRRVLAGPPGFGFTRGLGRAKFAQAPVISSYTAPNGMTTTTRSSRNMPIEERIATIQDMVAKSVEDGRMRVLALQITNGCAERDKMCEARSIYNFTKANVRYTGDVGNIQHADGTVEGIDLYQTAYRTIYDTKGGDCDDQAIVNATLLAHNGIDPIFRVVKAKGDPDWSHIFAGGLINNRFVALDTTVPGSSYFDKEPPYKTRRDFVA